MRLWILGFVFLWVQLYQSPCANRSSVAQEAIEPDWSRRVEQALVEGKGEEALAIVDRVVAAAPNQPSFYLVRGMVHFRLGNIKESLVDFDKSIDLNPISRAECWQRGISLYYLKEYEAGQKQFEVHRTVNPNDVENAFWHFLCVAKKEGVDAARASLLPCGRDSRPPLMDVLELLRGNKEPTAVIEAANAAHGGPTGKSVARFYGHLYVGLYYDALGQIDNAKEHLESSIAEKTGGYMRDVAVVHLRSLGSPSK